MLDAALMNPAEPLQYPPHLPPTGKWQRFFIGVRWLGPDLSFLKQLSAQQESRTSELMDQWGGGTRQQVATQTSAILARHLRWPSTHFLPGDNLGVIASGPRFGIIDSDLDAEDAIANIEKQLGVSMPREFWQAAGSSTFGEVVDQLLAAGAASNNSFKPKPLRGSA